MHRIIADHSMIKDNTNLVDNAIRIYDTHQNWDIYSIILASQKSINNWMLKEAALSVWGADAVEKTEKTEKIEKDYDAVWFWKKDCTNNLLDCKGADVNGYQRDLLVFNKSGSLFYYLIDK